MKQAKPLVLCLFLALPGLAPARPATAQTTVLPDLPSTSVSATTDESARPAAAQASDQELQGGQDWQFLQARETAVLSPAIGGIVARIPFEPGQFVKRGDVLMMLDPNLVQLEVRKLQQQIIMARAVRIGQVQISLAYATDNYEILKKLNKQSKGDMPVTSEMEVKVAAEKKEMAELELKKAHQEVILLELELAHNRKLLEQHSIRAPMNGVLVPFSSVADLNQEGQPRLKRIAVGEIVQPGRPALALLQVDSLRLPWLLSRDRLNTIHLGQQVNIRLRGDNGETVPARIVFVSPTINPGTKEFLVEAEFVNVLRPDAAAAAPGAYPYKYRPGMEACVELPAAPAHP